MAPPKNGSSSTDSRSNLEMLVLMEGGQPEDPEKNPRSKDENQQQTQPHMTPEPGIEPGPHWWKASALTTAPSLLPQNWFLFWKEYKPLLKKT